LIRLALPNHAPAVEPIIGQPHYSQPSLTSPPYIRQHGQLRETSVHSMPASTSAYLYGWLGACSNSQSTP